MVLELRRSMDLFEPIPYSAMNASCSVLTPKMLSNPISFKLDEENYLPWKQQALATIKSHKLHNYLSKDMVTRRYSVTTQT